MIEDVKRQTLNSSTFYKSIIRIDFRPIEKVTSRYHKPRHKKGEVVYKRNFFTGKKKVIRVYVEDIWTYDTYGGPIEMTINEYAKKCDLLVIEGELYRRPVVTIETTNKDNNRTITFENNIEALDYIAEIKENCKLCENNLL